MNVPVDEAAVVSEVVGGNVDAGKVVDDWPDTCVVDPVIVEMGVVDPVIVELGAVEPAKVEMVVELGVVVPDAV